MARISQDEIDALRNRANIVDVISHYIQVHRKGKSYVALCPFHNDHDPSLSISPDKQIYKCFVCGKGGNVFTFVQDYEKISFPEAVGRVAEMTGFQLSVQPEAVQAPKDPHKAKLYDVLKETISYTMYEMGTPAASAAREYLDGRGLNEEIRKVFQIGWNPGGGALSRFLKAKGYEEKDLVGANVASVTDSGIHDIFRERITFPIHDAHGNPIGFSARTMDPENSSKYINTNDTDIFHKGDIVYNFHRARADARREGKIYVCEGVTDVIAFYRAGISNAVCTLGTSCTDHQIRLLKSSAARIVFCYDGDHAGQAATMRAARMAREAGCDVSIVLNRTGKDPDEIIRDEGAEALQKMVRQEISWMEFVLSYLKSSTNMDSYLEKKNMANEAMIEINALPDETDRRYFTDKLSEMTGFHLEYARMPKNEPERLPVSGRPLHTNTVPDGAQKAEEQILCMMMGSPEASRYFEEKLGYLISDDSQKLAMMIIDAMHSKGKAEPADLMDSCNSESIRDLISRIAVREDYGGPFDEARMRGAIRKIKLTILTKEVEGYREGLSKELNRQSSQVLLEKYRQCLMDLRRLIDEDNSEEENQ